MNRKMETLRHQRDELYQDARRHPDSEADQMVQILLLSALRNQQAGDYDADLSDTLARQRRGYREAQAKRSQERQRAVPSEAAKTGSRGTGAARTEAAGSEAGWGTAAGREASENEFGRAEAETRLKKVAEALQNAKAAAESGNEMDPMQIYRKIAEVVGLNSPLQPIGEHPNASKDSSGV
jgi:hypothetical protein